MTSPTLNQISIALFQPDMPQNVGAAMRLAACMGAPLHIIEPCGFLWKEQEFRRTGMDYRKLVDLHRHNSWDQFLERTGSTDSPQHRLILMTTKGATPLYDFQFQDGDILLMGQESKGAPDHVHEQADARIIIPMHGTSRSLNIVNACAIALGEAARQIKFS
jgi:tRNA (cytidine/uridine-2'-O-)-methyltransferase